MILIASVLCGIAGSSMFAFMDTAKLFMRLKPFICLMAIAILGTLSLIMIDPIRAAYAITSLIASFFMLCMAGIVMRELA